MLSFAIRVLTVLLLAVLFVFAYVGFAILSRRFGAGATFAATALFAGLAAWLATPESRTVCEDFSWALRDARLSQKEAAITMGIATDQLSRQLSGLEQLSLSRAASLPPTFWAAFAKLRLQRVGGYTVLEDGAVTELVHAVRALRQPTSWKGAA